MGRFKDEITIIDALTSIEDLISQVDTVLHFIQKNISKKSFITGKAQREEIWQYPIDGLREIVINMIVHRDYTANSDSVVKIFDDRIYSETEEKWHIATTRWAQRRTLRDYEKIKSTTNHRAMAPPITDHRPPELNLPRKI